VAIDNAASECISTARLASVNDPEINAVVIKHYDYGARQSDNGLPDGPFTGVPFLLQAR
jgi:amidase